MLTPALESIWVPHSALMAGCVLVANGSSNAGVSTLRYHQRWGSDQDEVVQEALADYDLTAATKMLASDPLYTRNMINANYRVRRRHNSLELVFAAGKITGIAPLFDRFVLGNASTLRGWSKFALDPLGGSRMVHSSINYAYRKFQAFYDAGAIWTAGSSAKRSNPPGWGSKRTGANWRWHFHSSRVVWTRCFMQV